ncbi:MAG: Tol-Pal system beta propeller repeat protein TolB [Candidatus Eisenbacteria bacterium]|uniref:Tol-Pal system beta propeller repeat protein TolB n=1 Tax=Eiseniibacteriota bacterium TaxID=2212470 RepID=A0A849SNI0_UNCEI|nr:Tol-Pal system beta propeller repeat protein TolB [Candidatus Eisenbacteria bacterium]
MTRISLPRRLASFALVALALALPARAQAPSDVKIDIRGTGQKIKLRLMPLEATGDRTSRAGATQADEVLGRDLEWSAVFDVQRASASVPAGWEPQARVAGRLEQHGNQVVLHGEVLDQPAGRAILKQEWRGPATELRRLVHEYADEIVRQFTGEPGVANSRIAFISHKGNEKELWVMDADGWYQRALTSDRSIAQSPAWSPEGSLLVFTSYRSGLGPRLFVTPSNGGKIYSVSGRPGLNTSGTYSPDGREIACTLSQDGNAEIYRLDARGGTPTRLTNHRAIDTSPSWSPTGREIAFTSNRGGGMSVHVMDRDGGSVRRLTYELGNTDSPAWSPKGDRIAFVSRTGGGFDIYTCRPDGGDLRLEVAGRSNENPHWSPDGRHLVFASNREGTFALFISHLDGSPARRLETGGMVAMSPAWSPRMTAGGSSSDGASRGDARKSAPQSDGGTR